MRRKIVWKQKELMKKYVFISMMALVTLVFTGCEKNEPCQFHKKTIDLLVNTNEWKFDDNAHQFYVRFNIDLLTANVYDYGEVSISREMTDAQNNPYQVALPMSLFMVETVDDGNGGTTDIFYTQHIDYRYGVGYVEIQLTNSDLAYETNGSDFVKPESMVFRMQLTY